MSDSIPCGSRAVDLAFSSVRPGNVWTGFEWVSPQRYDELRLTSMPYLPPMQPTRDELRDLAAEAGEARAELAALVPTPPAAIPLPPWKLKPGELRRGWAGVPCDTLLLDSALSLLRGIGGEADPHRPGLAETPNRMVKAWKEWTAGYAQDPADVFKTFEDGAEGCDEMVIVENIPVYSKCEHHLADIFGTATIGYIPDGRIVGLSKLSRLTDVFARRLQVQERLTNQIAEALALHLKPKGCGVVIRARHMCMESRGIRQAGQLTTTSALRGVFKTDSAARAEFLNFARS